MTDPKEVKKSKKWIWTASIILIAIIITTSIIAYYTNKNPTGQNTNTTNTQPPTQEKNTKTIIITILVISLILSLAYIAYLAFIKGKTPSGKVTIPADRAVHQALKHFAKRQKITLTYNDKQKDHTPIDNAITTEDHLYWHHKQTGESFFLIEIHAKQGMLQGIHTLALPLERGEQAISQGLYRLHAHTPINQFKLDKYNFDMSSVEDKQERYNLAMVEKMETKKAEEYMQKQMEKKNITQIPDEYLEYPYQNQKVGGIKK